MDNVSPAVKSLQSACRLFLADLQALPEEAFAKEFGGKARTVADIVYEVNLVNDHIGMVIRGEEPFTWPEGDDWITAPAELKSRDAVIESFEKSSQKILATAEALSQEDLDAPLTTENGETNRGERCRFMAMHMMYHCGQLNFIQAMLGDDKMHWR
jgi:uncharacterized damage-inducible protein DinB